MPKQLPMLGEHELEPFPEIRHIQFKDRYVERYKKLTDWDVYKKYTLSFLRKSIRINTIKTTTNEIKKRLEKDWKLTQVPWCKEGFWIKGTRLDVGNLAEHVLGYVYIQEAAAMIPAIVLNPQKNELILDIAAAPGGKTTQIAQYMDNTGLIIANDFGSDRMAALGVNVQRCGLTNCMITEMQGQWFKKSDFEFDRILVDAPCSGTGTVRKSVKTLLLWNIDMIRKMATLQKQLLETAWERLKKGGTMVYSTCSLEPEENEANVDWFLHKFEDAKIKDIKLDINRTPAIEEFEGERYSSEVKKSLRLWPQDNDTEGFFVAKFVKS